MSCATQREVEQPAADRERSLISRDLHDVLGRSLAVVTVEADLAGRLVDLDAGRAKAAPSEIQELTRGALADVRNHLSRAFGKAGGRNRADAARSAEEIGWL